jgi:hypothetical protein
MIISRRPAQLLLRDLAPEPELRSLILKDYVRIDDAGASNHYVRRDRMDAVVGALDHSRKP